MKHLILDLLRKYLKEKEKKVRGYKVVKFLYLLVFIKHKINNNMNFHLSSSRLHSILDCTYTLQAGCRTRHVQSNSEDTPKDHIHELEFILIYITLIFYDHT